MKLALRHRESDADVAAAVVAVGGVDPDVDRLVGVGERSDPAAHGDRVLAGQGDRVDAAADPALGFALIHRHIRLPEWPRDQRPVEQVARPDPQSPLGLDVESEAGRVLVELAHLRVDRRRVEVGTGQVVQRRDDADVGSIGDIGAPMVSARSRT